MHRIVFRIFTILLALTLFSFIGCAEDDSGGGGGRTGDDDDDDDDDDGNGDCGDVIFNPYCLDGVTFEIEGASLGMLSIRSLFFRFGAYDLEGQKYGMTIASGTASAPTQPSATNRASTNADYAQIPIFSTGTDKLNMPVELDLPVAKGAKEELEIEMNNLLVTGIMQNDGQTFIFASISFSIPGTWFAENLPSEVCQALPDLCTNGLNIFQDNFTGNRRDDAVW